MLCGAALLGGNSMPTFQGNLAKNPNACLLNIKKMNGRDSHTLRVHKGDMLRVRFEA